MADVYIAAMKTSHLSLQMIKKLPNEQLEEPKKGCHFDCS